MPGPLRRSRRLVALLLLLLTPALGGWAVKTAHSCPTALGADLHAQPEPGHHGLPAHGGHGAECHCIGSCHTPPAVIPPAPAPLGVAVAEPAPAPVRAHGALPVPASRLSDFLPPSTAPPQG
jgi:hypothetical protein